MCSDHVAVVVTILTKLGVTYMGHKRVQKRFTSHVNIVEFQQPKPIKPKRYSV